MSLVGLPDFPITPIQRGKGVSAVDRNLPFKPPFASTPISRIPVKVAKDGEMEKGKTAVVLRQQNEAAPVKPLKRQNQKSSEVVNSLQSSLLISRNQPLGVKPATSETKSLEGDVVTVQATVEKPVVIGKTASIGIEKTAVSKGDAQRKLGGRVEIRTSLVPESKGEGKEKGHLGSRSGSIKPLDNADTILSFNQCFVKFCDNAIQVASEPRKGAEKNGRSDENALRLDESKQNTDSHVGQLTKRSSSNALQGKRLESGHTVTKTSSKSTGSGKSRTKNGKEADGKTLTSQTIESKGLHPKDAKANKGSAQVKSDSNLRTARADSAALNKNPAEIKSLTRAPNSRSLETKENKFKGKPSVDKTKSVLAQTTDSTNVVKTKTNKSSGRVSTASMAEKERVSVSTASKVQIPEVKTSVKIDPLVVASRVSAVQSVASEGLTSDVTGSVFTNSDSTRSQGKDQQTLADSVEPASGKTRAVKRAASPEISGDLENSTEASDRADRRTVPNNKPKRRRMVIEDSEEGSPSASKQPERRFLKQKIPKPKKLLPNSSEEKIVKQAQNSNRQRSFEQKDIELKVKPQIYQRWKLASKQTVEFAMGTLMQSFEEKFRSQKVDLVNLVKYFEELKTRMVSDVSLVKVPTSRQPVNYMALTTQEATLETHLDESSMDVEQINNTIRNCKKSNEKLKILKERLQSKRVTTDEAERLYEAACEQSRSSVGSIHTTEQSKMSETQEV